MILNRALIWSLAGLIYAPLFTGLYLGFDTLGLDAWSYVPAAALAGAVGAIFYGARGVALAATGIGLTVATFLFFVMPDRFDVPGVATIAALVGAGLGLIARFPDRCSLGVPGKALAGAMGGLACGGLLAATAAFWSDLVSLAVILAFLVSVNGMLYVVSVRWWVGVTTPKSRTEYCNLIESLVIAILAACAAGGLWLMVGPITGFAEASEMAISQAVQREIPLAVIGGLIGGAVSGALLEAFRFRNVFDL